MRTYSIVIDTALEIDEDQEERLLQMVSDITGSTEVSLVLDSIEGE